MNPDETSNKYTEKLSTINNKFQTINSDLKNIRTNTLLFSTKLNNLRNDFSTGYNDIINHLTYIIENVDKLNKLEKEEVEESPAAFITNKITNFEKGESYLLDEMKCQSLIEWIGKEVRFERIYKATKDGFAGQSFHNCCDKKGANVVVMLNSNDKTLGGYTPLSWGVTNGYNRDDSKEGFLFSFDMMEKFEMKDGTYAICSSDGSGPKYGGGHDLDIVGDCNTEQNNYSGIGFTYNFANKSKDSLYGDGSINKYTVIDYEVYRVV